MSLVIGVSGKINSGKTTIANFISERYHFNYVSFGNFLRNQAKMHGFKATRRVLQDLGQNFVESDVDAFTKNVLYSNNWDGISSLVIDGIRHINVYKSIQNHITPLRFRLIYVATDDIIRQERDKSSNINILENHPVERDTKADLIRVADLVIDGNLSLEKNAKKLEKWMNSFGFV